MDGMAAKFEDYNMLNDLSRRDSKRRRLLGHRLAEDPTNPDLQWQPAPYAPNFFTVTSSRPNRMQESLGIVPTHSVDWIAEHHGQLPPDVSLYDEQASHATQPFFLGQTHPTSYQPMPWTSADAEHSIYNISSTSYPDVLPQEPQALKFRDSAQYLDPHGGCESLYQTPSTSFVSNRMPILPANVPLSTHGSGRSSISQSAAPQVLAQLDALAVQIIQMAAARNHAEFQDLMYAADPAARAFRAAKDMFDQTFRSIGPGQDFLGLSGTQMSSSSQQDIARRANTVVLILSVLGAHELSFMQLNHAFLDVFVPLGHRLLKWQGALYLELKTQAYIMALLNNEGLPEVLLEDLFPSDMDAQILQRHPDAPSLSPSEQDFVDRCRARRQYLLIESFSDNARADLPLRYQWTDFVREFSSCISKNVEHILSSLHKSVSNSAGSRRRAGTGPASREVSMYGCNGAMEVKRSVSTGAGADKRTAGGQTVRQAWTTAEEAALLAGLEHVAGPHWSQILALYGRGGSMSEVLKDRNQVQLKDKARNLKLWYLKMGQEVPIPLRGVTGELRKRGGARARAALEAEETGNKERGSSDETETADGVEAMLDIQHDTIEPDVYYARV